MDRHKTLWQSQNATLRSIQDNIKSLKASIKSLEDKIETDGISGNYSANHDCWRYSTNIWKGCLRLYELKKLQYELEDKDSFGMPKKTNHN